jgi:hypothetical protein
VEQARRDVDVAARDRRRLRVKNSTQWRGAGLYDPISDATIARSIGTPIRRIDASM